MDAVEKWTKLIEALTEMGKNTIMAELGLYKLRDEAASVWNRRCLVRILNRGCARFPEFVENFSERQVLYSVVFLLLH